MRRIRSSIDTNQTDINLTIIVQNWNTPVTEFVYCSSCSFFSEWSIIIKWSVLLIIIRNEVISEIYNDFKTTLFLIGSPKRLSSWSADLNEADTRLDFQVSHRQNRTHAIIIIFLKVQVFFLKLLCIYAIFLFST